MSEMQNLESRLTICLPVHLHCQFLFKIADYTYLPVAKINEVALFAIPLDVCGRPDSELCREIISSIQATSIGKRERERALLSEQSTMRATWDWWWWIELIYACWHLVDKSTLWEEAKRTIVQIVRTYFKMPNFEI